MKLAGLCAIVTGASQGFGLEVAKRFVIEGASVAICARNAEQLAEAQVQLERLTNKNKVIASVCDVMKFHDVEQLIARAHETFGKIDILVANAGIYGPKGPIEEVDWEEWSQAIDINLKGTVLTCRAVLPHFKLNQSGKIIILSGGGATKPMPFLSAYAASKAGVVRFAETLAQEIEKYGIDVNTVAPGPLNTRLLDEILDAGPEKVGSIFYTQALQQKKQGGTPFEKGAALCVYLASSDSNSITGKLISAVWDPWQDLAKYKKELLALDIYTLRRILPEDRKVKWD